MKAEHFLMAMLFIAGGIIMLVLYARGAHAGPIPDWQYAVCTGDYQACQYEAQLARREAYKQCDGIGDRMERILCYREARRQRREDWGICRCDLACCRRGWR